MKIAQKRIYVNHCERTPDRDPQGRNKQTMTYVDGNGMQRTRARGMKRDIGIGEFTPFKFPLGNTGMWVTGLEKSIENPYFMGTDKDGAKRMLEYIGDKVNWDKAALKQIIEYPTITRQTYLEVKYDQPKNHLSPVQKGILIFNMPGRTIEEIKGHVPTEIERFTLNLYPNKTNVFTDESLRGELAMLLCENHPSIANSSRDIGPNSVYYISVTNEAEIEKERLEDRENLAIAKLVSLYDLPEMTMYKVATLCTDTKNRSIIRGDMNKAAVKIALNDYIKNTGKFQKEAIERFMKYCEQLNTKEGLQKLNVQYAVQQALNNNTIALRDGYYYWWSMAPNKADKPSMYKITNSFDAMVNIFLQEYITHDPNLPVENWYGELEKELTIRGIKF